MIKICQLHDGAVSLHAVHVMLKVAQLHKLGEYVRVYALDALGNPAEYWHQGDMRRPVTSFPEWGIEFEKGIICSAVGTPKEDPGGGGVLVVTSTGSARVRPFGMEGAIREGWGKPTLRHAIGYLEERYGAQAADAIAMLKDRAALMPESPPGRPAPW